LSYRFDVLMSKNKIKIIWMYFWAKNTLKSNIYHTLKHHFNMLNLTYQSHNVSSTSQYNLLYWFILEFNYVFFPFLTSISFLLIIVTIFVF